MQSNPASGTINIIATANAVSVDMQSNSAYGAMIGGKVLRDNIASYFKTIASCIAI